jgi:hypothetical protein
VSPGDLRIDAAASSRATCSSSVLGVIDLRIDRRHDVRRVDRRHNIGENEAPTGVERFRDPSEKIGLAVSVEMMQ